MTVGERVAFNMLFQRVSQQVLWLAQLWRDFRQARLSVERLGDILNTLPKPGAAAAPALPAIQGAARFAHVRFRHRLDGPLVGYVRSGP